MQQSTSSRRMSMAGDMQFPASPSDQLGMGVFTPEKPRRATYDGPTLDSVPVALMLDQSHSREKKWQVSNAALKRQIETLKQFSQKQSKQHQSDKMMLKFREQAITRFGVTLRTKDFDAGQELLFSEIDRMTKDNEALRVQLENNPLVTEKTLEILELYEALETLKGDPEKEYEHSAKLIEIAKEHEELKALCSSPRKVLDRMTTPQKRGFEAFELGRWKQEQQHDAKFATIQEELNASTEEAIAFKGMLEDTEVERNSAQAQVKEHASALAEVKAHVEAMEMRHANELERLATQKAQSEEDIHMIYAGELKALDSGMKVDAAQSASQSASHIIELATSKSRFASVEAEVKSLREVLRQRDSQVSAHSERIQALVVTTGEQEADKLRTTEIITGLQQQLVTATNEAAAMNQKLLDVAAELEGSRSAGRELEVVAEKLRKDVEVLRLKKGAARDEVDRLEQALETTRVEIDRLSFNADLLQEDHESMTENFNYQEGCLKEVTAANEGLQVKMGEVEEMLFKSQSKLAERVVEVQGLKEDLHNMAEKGVDSAALLASKQALEEALSELQQDMADVNAELTAEIKAGQVQEGQMEGLTKEKACLATSLQEVRGAYAELQAHGEEQEARLSELFVEVEDQGDLALRQEEQIEMHSARTTELSGQVKQLEEAAELARATLEAELAPYKEELPKALTALKETQEARTLLAKQFEAGKQAYEKLLDEKMAEVAAVEQAKQDEVLAAQTSAYALNAQVRGLEGELEAALSSSANEASLAKELERRVQQATGEFKKKQEAFERLTTQLKGAQKEREEVVSRLQAQVKVLQEEKEAQTVSYNTISNQYEQVKNNTGTASEQFVADKAALSKQLELSRHHIEEQAEDLDKQTLETAQAKAQLKGLAEQLKQSLQAKEGLMEDAAACRREEEDAHTLSEKLQSDLEQLKGESRKFRAEVTPIMTENEELKKLNAKLIGHQNPKQKIQHHMKIKNENDVLKKDKAAVEREVRKLRLALKKHGVTVEEDKENEGPDADEEHLQALTKQHTVAENTVQRLAQAILLMDSTAEPLIESNQQAAAAPLCEEGLPSKVGKAIDLEKYVRLIEHVSQSLTETKTELARANRTITSKDRELKFVRNQAELKHEAQLVDNAVSSLGDLLDA
jgi:chromosome segregation ATPase